MAEILNLNEEQQQELSQLPPELITPLISPTGELVQALPQHLDGLIKEGYTPKYSNQKFRVSKEAWSEPQDVTGVELNQFVSDGWKVNQADRYYDMRQKKLEAIEAKERPTDWIRAIAGGSGALASGMSFGASDLILRGSFEGLEGLGLLEEGEAKDIAKTQLSSRDELGNYATALEMLGGVATGGILTKAGKTVAQRVALSGLEGALGGGGYVAGRQALGDENINAESYMWGVGLGGVLGIGTQKVGELVRKVSKAPKIEVSDVKFQNDLMDGIVKAEQGIEKRGTVPMFNDKGDNIGFIELSNNVGSSHHVAGKTGLNIESIDFLDGISKEAREAYENGLVNKLVSNYGAIASPTDLSKMSPELQEMFSRYGISRTTPTAEKFYIIGEETLPDPETMYGQRYAKWMIEKLGKMPEKGTKEYELFQKVFDPRKQSFAREFLDYHNSYEDFLNKATKDITEVVDMSKANTKVANQVREEIINSVDNSKLPELKTSVIDLTSNIQKRIDDIRSYNVTDLDGVANALERHRKTLDGIIQKTDAVEAYRAFYNAKRDVFELTSHLKAKESAGKYLNSESKQAIEGLVEDFNKVLKNPNIIGQEAAVAFAKLDLYASSMIKSSNVFNKVYKVDNPTQFQRAVKQAFRPREGGVAGQQAVLDKMSADMEAFNSVLKEIKGKGFLKNIEVPDITQTKKALLNVGKMREYQVISQILYKVRSSEGIIGGIVAGSASIGGIGGSIVGASMGAPLLGVVGGAVSSIALSSFARKWLDPKDLLKRSLQVDGHVASTRRVIEKATDGLQKAQVLNRASLASSIGLTKKAIERPNDYANNVYNKIQQMRELSESIYGTIGDELIEDAMKKKIEKSADYILEKMPKIQRGVNLTTADSRTIDKLLVSAFQPQQALEHALLSGDREVLEHLKALYPNMIETMQAHMLATADMDSKNLKTRSVVRDFTGHTNQRKSTIKNAQATFAKKEDKGGKMNVQIPDMPIGSAIQGR